MGANMRRESMQYQFSEHDEQEEEKGDESEIYHDIFYMKEQESVSKSSSSNSKSNPSSKLSEESKSLDNNNSLFKSQRRIVLQRKL